MTPVSILKRNITDLYLASDVSIRTVMDWLMDIDFYALQQAVSDNMRMVFAYATKSRLPKVFNICTGDLFDQEAILLLDDLRTECEMVDAGNLVCTKSMELWLLEDMSLAVTTRFGVNCFHDRFVANYRSIKEGDPWKSGLHLDLSELTGTLKDMCMASHNFDTPIYEV